MTGTGAWILGGADPDRIIDTLLFSATEIGANSSVNFDEVRFGETFEDVVPTPEPSSSVLVVLGALKTMWQRRR